MSEVKKRILILVIEDEEILTRALEEKLLVEGFDVSIATNGIDGLKLALKEHPDLILLDVLIPKLDGATLLKGLREDSWGAHAKVIILTNVKETGKMNEMMNVGLDVPNNTFDYLVKTDLSLSAIVDKIKLRLLEK